MQLIGCMSSVTKTASKINPRRSALSLGPYLLVGALANELLLVARIVAEAPLQRISVDGVVHPIAEGSDRRRVVGLGRGLGQRRGRRAVAGIGRWIGRRNVRAAAARIFTGRWARSAGCAVPSRIMRGEL